MSMESKILLVVPENSTPLVSCSFNQGDTNQLLEGSSVQPKLAPRQSSRSVSAKNFTGSPSEPSLSVPVMPQPGSFDGKKPGTPRQGSAKSAIGSIQQSKICAGATGKTEAQDPKSSMVCELCDVDMKDLEHLGNHLESVHRVHLHLRLLQGERPPFSCHKCPYHFFTNKGVERHLLGAHSLVAPSLQDAASKHRDSGCCPICAEMCQSKLLEHVANDHRRNLKPVRLSYRCITCKATFPMYRSCRQHVSDKHSPSEERNALSKQGNDVQQESSASRQTAPGRTSASLSSRLPPDLAGPVQISGKHAVIPQSKSGSGAAPKPRTELQQCQERRSEGTVKEYLEEKPLPTGDQEKVQLLSDHEDITDEEGTNNRDSRAGMTIHKPDIKLEAGKEMFVPKQCRGDDILGRSIDRIVDRISQLEEQCLREKQKLLAEVADLKEENALLKEDFAGKVKRFCDLEKKLVREKKIFTEENDKLQQENNDLKRRLHEIKASFVEREESLKNRQVALERLADSIKNDISSLASGVF